MRRDRCAAGLECEVACRKPLAGYQNTRTGGIVFVKNEDAGKPMQVACGQCLMCRLDRASEWAARIMHEASMWEENCCVTVTYNEQNMPADGSLNKKHAQKFIKRLRQKFKGRRIRYYYCGEYGDELDRPHYHFCFFNLDFSDKELFKQEQGINLFVSKTLEQVWGKGFCTVGELTFQSAAYVARYVLKKVTGARAEDHYLRCDEHGVAYWLEPEYTQMSLGRKKGQGIGGTWYEKFKGDVFPSDETPVPGKGVYKGAPRYYEKILDREDPGMLEAVKRARQAYLKENLSEYSPERLEAKYKVKKASMANMTRGLRL